MKKKEFMQETKKTDVAKKQPIEAAKEVQTRQYILDEIPAIQLCERCAARIENDEIEELLRQIQAGEFDD